MKILHSQLLISVACLINSVYEVKCQCLTEGGTYLHPSATPNTTKIFCTLFKLIQPSNMVTLSCLAKKKLLLKV